MYTTLKKFKEANEINTKYGKGPKGGLGEGPILDPVLLIKAAEFEE